jgi:hypothetical protein
MANLNLSSPYGYLNEISMDYAVQVHTSLVPIITCSILKQVENVQYLPTIT